ncbi:tape measure protein [Enterobacteriaceae bacterium ESL0689]|nr:tape measure protein [Enterobacteriaceae bacterium ESL0689]
MTEQKQDKTNVGTIVYEVDIETARLLQGRRDIDAALNGLTGGMGRLETSVTRAERSISSIEGSISRLTSVARGLMAVLSVQQVTDYANSWVTLNNKLANARRPNEQLAEVTERVFDISQKTMSSLDATATLYARLERATRTAGTGVADLIKLTETINKGLVVSGATTQEASSAMIQLSQALASGVLRGEEFNSISENGSRLAVALAQSLGVTIGQLREMAAKGKLTTDVVVKGLLSQGDQIAKEFANTTMTLSQAFNIATNNVTKFVGESTTIKSVYAASSGAIVSLSQNIDVLSKAVMAVSLLMGGRYLSAIALATTGKIKSAMAAVQQSAAERQLAKDEMGAAQAIQRRAAVEKQAALDERARAEQTLAGLKATNAATVAEVARADAELASIKVSLEQIQAEKALEIQRLKSQVSEQGRIATATRMAELRKAEAVLTTRLANAESAAQAARSAAYETASAKITAANGAVITTTEALRAANGRLAASQEIVTATSFSMANAVKSINTLLMPLGGIGGVLLAVAAGWYLYAQNQAQARQEAIAFADTLPDVIKHLKELNRVQAEGAKADTISSIKAQKEAINELEKSVADLKSKYEESMDAARQMAVEQDEENGHVIRAKNIANELAQKRRDLENANKTLKASEDALLQINTRVNDTIVEQMKAARDNAIALAEAEKKASFLSKAQEFLAEMFGLTTQAMKEFNAETLKVNWGGKEGEKLLKQAERRLALSKLEGAERAKLQAQYDAEDAGIADERAIKILQEKYAATEQNKTATKENTAETEKATRQHETAAQKLSELKRQSELAADSTKELSREQAILAAQQLLGKGATSEQLAEAAKYAGIKWDTANALKAQAAAEKLLPETKENASYKQDLLDLKTALDGKRITLEQFNRTTELLEQQHQINLAKIRADQIATNPVAEARAQVDPVQQLANQNNQKLALLQQYQQQEQAILTQSYQNGNLSYDQYIAAKAKTDAQYLELKNAQETEYEQQRIAAQWEIYRNQSQAYELLAASIDGFQSGASSAITGLINGTQSLQEAFVNIGTTILNSVVSSLVEMGVQWVKSQIMGQAQASASLAETEALATAAATSWAPAAVSASIATYGGASTVGQTAYAGALVAAQGMAAAGARYNGGPVSANSMYRVGENGKPEIFKASSGEQYMIPGDNGRVISNRDIGSGGSAGGVQNVYFTINTTGGIGEADWAKIEARAMAISKKMALFQINDQASRPGGLIQPRTKR